MRIAPYEFLALERTLLPSQFAMLMLAMAHRACK
jgi:hypothetical protein